MNRFIEIANRAELRNIFSALKADTVPLWGKMSSRQMVEHLINQVRYTNGKLIPTCDVPEDEAHRRKQQAIYTDAEIPHNVVLETLSEEFEYEDMETAIAQLIAELDAFDRYFTEPGVTVVHGGFGPMTYQEWHIWHNKHFTHHLKQFGLI